MKKSICAHFSRKKVINNFRIIFFFLPILTFSFFLPLSPTDTDFSVLYLSNQSLLNGIQLYDYQAQLDFLQKQVNEDLIFYPYPYPPWYALATIFLAFPPAETAFRLWFTLNLTMIAVSVWVMTTHWKMKSRILILYGASTFFPVLGLLVVGQYSAPVLLGAALLMWAIRKESALGTAFAFGLLTFKPHLGLIIAVIMVVWLFFNRKKPFARQAIVFTFCCAVLLFFTGFLADRTWPISYIRTLGQYLGISGVHSCGICASLPVMLVEILNGYRNIYLGAAISIFLATGMAGLLLRHFGAQLLNETLVITLAAAFTLLVDPYLLGYDFILLVIVFVVLIERDLSIIGKLGIIIAYLLPWIILLLGRDGYFVLLVSTVILMTLLWNFPKQTSLKIDV